MSGLAYTFCVLVTVIFKSNVLLRHVDSSIVFYRVGWVVLNTWLLLYMKK